MYNKCSFDTKNKLHSNQVFIILASACYLNNLIHYFHVKLLIYLAMRSYSQIIHLKFIAKLHFVRHNSITDSLEKN